METNYDNGMEQSNSNSIARIRNSNSKNLIKKTNPTSTVSMGS